MEPVIFVDEKDLDDALIGRISLLREQVWNRTGTVERMQGLREQARSTSVPWRHRPRCLTIHRQGRLIAFGRIFARTVIQVEKSVTVLALASVCSAPDLRGQGLGKAIVAAAFGLVDQGDFEVSLFQTSRKVQPFYEKLGCRLMNNLIFNSKSDQPQSNPFWDEVSMCYPAAAPWSAAPIDLQGPGY